MPGTSNNRWWCSYLYDADFTSHRHSSCLYSLTNLSVASSDHLLGIFLSVRVLQKINTNQDKSYSVQYLTLNLLTTTKVAPPSNARKWQMGFNLAFKGLMWRAKSSETIKCRAQLCVGPHPLQVNSIHCYCWMRYNYAFPNDSTAHVRKIYIFPGRLVPHLPSPDVDWTSILVPTNVRMDVESISEGGALIGNSPLISHWQNKHENNYDP
jgi:hypothetical protein